MLRQFLSKVSVQPIGRVLIQRCFSLQQNGPTNVQRLLTPLLLNSTLPKLSPSVNNSTIEKEIEHIWKMPEYLPSCLIVPTVKQDFWLPVENPDLAKLEKQAARMIVIRRRKMKKHKLRKLRKVRKFEYRRVALKRKTLKEKDFQMQLMAQIKEAGKFDAKTYVEEVIRIAKEEIVKPPRIHPGFKTNPTLYDEKGNRIKLNQHLFGKK